MIPTRRASRGAVLIVVLGILVVLALLSVTFATLQATERQISRNYLDTVRAKLLAQSGVEDAQARLREYFPFRALQPGPQPWTYWGTNSAESGEPGPAPIESALNPSFAYEDEQVQDPGDSNVKPKLLSVDGRRCGFSGCMTSGTYGLFGDQYVLKVGDLSGRVHVNDGVEAGPGGSVSQNLRRILNALGAVSTVSVPGLGDRVLAGRPASGYRHVDELRGGLGEQEFARARDFLTAHAWADRDVAQPVPLSAATAARSPVRYHRGSLPVYRLGHSKDASGRTLPGDLDTCPPSTSGDDSIRVYGLDALNPQWVEIVSRAPVNVNSARREVLIALLADLKGFFLTDRRRNNPRWEGDCYTAFAGRNTYSPQKGLAAGYPQNPQVDEGDEIGFLMETAPILAGSGTVTGGISAAAIADEIIACRGRGRGRFNGFDYGSPSCGFGGPFKNWAQFYAFIDHLVTMGLIQDDRPIWLDYLDRGVDEAGYAPLVPSEIQRKHAARAVADVLKANFNPNLHLNELNPDENLHLIVDKTDLIVHSTEFTFLPTGYVEVESLGRILRPRAGSTDCLQSPDNEMVAQAKVIAVLKLYELYRETHQKHFHAGKLLARAGPFETNNNKSLEIGPEPDNGTGPSENEWGGYIALPTVGSVYHAAPEHPKDAIVSTASLPAVKQFDAAFHVHYTLDFDAHDHVLGPDAREELAGRMLPDEKVSNFPDALPGAADTPYPGPYGPASGPGNVHRLARSFRLSAGGTSAALKPFAPSDLRIDGAYSERHAAPAYYLQKGGRSVWRFNEEVARGMVGFWMKPSFAPERTGKIRAFWDLSRYHEPCFQDINVCPFALWFFPCHRQVNAPDSNLPEYNWFATGDLNKVWGKFHPASLGFGALTWHDQFCSFGGLTASLNHRGHPDEGVRPSPLDAHRWVNLTFTWEADPGGGGESARLYVNGTRADPFYEFWDARDKLQYFDRHDDGKGGSGTGDLNHMRLGGPSRIADGVGDPYRGNYSADATIDELYVWRSPRDENPDVLWMRGRYCKPEAGTSGAGAIFESAPLKLVAQSGRSLPPSPRAASGPGSTGASPRSAIRVLGIAWTWYGEAVDAAGKRVLYDHNSATGVNLVDVEPAVEVGLFEGPNLLGGKMADQDEYSAVRSSDGTAPVIRDIEQLRYKVQFRLKKAELSTILLASPVLDDVTLYWESDGPVLLSYTFVNRSY